MHDSTHTHTHNALTKRLICYLANKTKNFRKQNNFLIVLFSVFISFLFVSLITYGATTISSNIDTGGNLTVSSNATLGDNATDLIKSIGSFYASSTLQSTGAVRFYSTARIDGATILNTVSYTWPSSDGSSSQYLQTNGAGTLSWATVSGGGASSDWNKQTNYGVLNLTASTTIPYWAKDAIYASSTLTVQGLTTLTNATTSLLTVSNGAWFTNGNVGIGTTSPGSLFSLNNIANFTTATSSFYGQGINLANGCFAINGVCSGGSGTINSGTTGQFPYYATNGTTLTATSSIFFSSNQNVGIGTTTPNWLLQVAGTRPFFTLSDTGAGTDNKHWFMSSQGGNFYVGTSSDALSATSTYFTITNGGKVGVMTTNPGHALDVNGKIRIAPNSASSGILYVGSGAGNILIDSTGGFQQQGAINNTAATTWFNFANGQGNWTDAGNYKQTYLKVSPNYNPSSATPQTSLAIFEVAPTFNPSAVAPVVSGQWIAANIAGTFGSGDELYNVSDPLIGLQINPAIKVSTNSTKNYTALSVNVLELSVSTSTNYLADFKVGNGTATSTRMVIATNGNVGIGTTTPTTMFQVATSTANATTTIEVGKANQNKGSCLKMYDVAGTLQYVSIQGGSFAISATSCE